LTIFGHAVSMYSRLEGRAVIYFAAQRQPGFAVDDQLRGEAPFFEVRNRRGGRGLRARPDGQRAQNEANR